MFYHKALPKFVASGVQSLSSTEGFRHFIFSLHADASTTATIRIKGSASQECPDFNEASTADNDWGYVAFRELETADLKAGAVGVAISATTLHKIYEVECNGLAHIAFDVSSLSGDGITVKAMVQED